MFYMNQIIWLKHFLNSKGVVTVGGTVVEWVAVLTHNYTCNWSDHQAHTHKIGLK